MAKHGKRYRAVEGKVDRERTYAADEATVLVKELATAKFDETIEVHVRLGIDPRKSDQNVRGTVALPHGTGRVIRVLAYRHLCAEPVASHRDRPHRIAS